jgi:hypothetical protein
MYNYSNKVFTETQITANNKTYNGYTTGLIPVNKDDIIRINRIGIIY